VGHASSLPPGWLAGPVATCDASVAAGDQGKRVQMQRRGHRPVVGWRGNGAWFMHRVGAMERPLDAGTSRAQGPSYLTSLGWETPSQP
jgi:hypothetical protein